MPNTTQELNLLAWLLIATACNTLLILIGFVALTRGLAQAGILDTRQNGAIWKLLRSVEIMTMNRIQVLVGRINGLIAAVASIIASLGIIRTKQTGLSNTLTKVQADVVFLRQQLADFLTNNPDLADAEAALASLESSVASLESDFAEVSQEVTNAEAAAAGIDSLTPEDADGDGVFSDTDQDDNDPNVGAFQP